MAVNLEENSLIMPETDKIVLDACQRKTFNVSHTEDTIIDINDHTATKD